MALLYAFFAVKFLWILRLASRHASLAAKGFAQNGDFFTSREAAKKNSVIPAKAGIQWPLFKKAKTMRLCQCKSFEI